MRKGGSPTVSTQQWEIMVIGGGGGGYDSVYGCVRGCMTGCMCVGMLKVELIQEAYLNQRIYGPIRGHSSLPRALHFVVIAHVPTASRGCVCGREGGWEREDERVGCERMC